MTRLTLIVLFLAGALPVAGFVYFFHANGEDVFEFYRQTMRGSFFAGFLTIGGFMLSLQTFVLVKMKEGLYSSDEYVRRAGAMRGVSSNVSSLYTPLRSLSHLLFFSILSALVTSALQLTLGLWKGWVSAATCVAFAGGTLTLLVFSLIQIRGNLDMWFDCLDKDADDKAKAETKAKGVPNDVSQQA